MGKDTLTPEESFDIITKAITNVKMNYKENAITFLLWGWILAVSSLSNFVILRVLNSRGAYNLNGVFTLANWGLFILTGFIIMLFILRKMNRTKKFNSYLDKYISIVWQVSAASFFVATFICIKLQITPPPVMLLIAGIATTVTGLLIKFTPLTLGGIAFFIFSIIAAYISNEYIALIVCLSIICGYLIPGYLLKSAKQ